MYKSIKYFNLTFGYPNSFLTFLFIVYFFSHDV